MMLKETLEKYIEKLENGINEYMYMPLSQRSAEAVQSMIECWEHVKAMCDDAEDCGSTELSENDFKSWMKSMENEDGTTGAHWTEEETQRYNRRKYDSMIWNAVMNMMYSDYYNIGRRYAGDQVDFYVELAEAFLDDKDAHGPEEKVGAYYHGIVE